MVSGIKATGFPSTPLICMVPLTIISAAEAFVAVPVYTFTIAPCSTVRVAPAFTVKAPVTWIREFAGHVVFAAIVPLTVVKTGAASIVIAGL